MRVSRMRRLASGRPDAPFVSGRRAAARRREAGADAGIVISAGRRLAAGDRAQLRDAARRVDAGAAAQVERVARRQRVAADVADHDRLGAPDLPAATAPWRNRSRIASASRVPPIVELRRSWFPPVRKMPVASPMGSMNASSLAWLRVTAWIGRTRLTPSSPNTCVYRWPASAP